MTLTRMPMPLQLAVGQRNGAKPTTRRRYDRAAAMAYAKMFWNRNCSDGYIAVKKKGTAPYREADPGVKFAIPSDELDPSDPERRKRLPEDGLAHSGKVPWGILDDCTHFTSCCIGRPYDALRLRPLLALKPGLTRQEAPRLPAGGLDVPSLEQVGAPWLYGIVGAPTLVGYLSRPHVGVVTANRLFEDDPRLVRAVNSLEAGDVIAIAPPDRGTVRRGYGHVVLYDGRNAIYAHTRCRDAEAGRATWKIGQDGAQYTCIHVLDEIEDRR